MLFRSEKLLAEMIEKKKAEIAEMKKKAKTASEEAKKSKFEEIHKIYLFFFVNRCIIYSQLKNGSLYTG